MMKCMGERQKTRKNRSKRHAFYAMMPLAAALAIAWTQKAK
jgi:hypothetical protein